MTWAAALFLVVAFMALLGAFGVPARAGAAVARSRAAIADLRNRALSDLDKEQAMQAHSRALFGLFLVITALSALALLLPSLLVWLGAVAGWYGFEAALDATLSWPILLGACVLGCGLYWLRRRR